VFGVERVIVAADTRVLMEYELIWVDPMLVICRVSGVPRAEDFIAMTREWLSSSKFAPGMDRVTDLTDLDAKTVSADVIERIATAGAGFGKGKPEMGRLVMVTGDSPVKFGLSRMFASHFKTHVEAPFHFFKTLDEALAFLRPDGLQPAPSSSGKAAEERS